MEKYVSYVSFGESPCKDGFQTRAYHTIHCIRFLSRPTNGLGGFQTKSNAINAASAPAFFREHPTLARRQRQHHEALQGMLLRDKPGYAKETDTIEMDKIYAFVKKTMERPYGCL
jgi:hypothetical protein